MTHVILRMKLRLWKHDVLGFFLPRLEIAEDNYVLLFNEMKRKLLNLQHRNRQEVVPFISIYASNARIDGSI